jgi:hypothetical protein
MWKEKRKRRKLERKREPQIYVIGAGWNVMISS